VDHIKLYVQKSRLEIVDCIHLAKVREYLSLYENIRVNLELHKMDFFDKLTTISLLREYLLHTVND
jgi:hypothetical protein